MPETQVGNRKINQTEVERNPLFASIEMAAEQITSTIAQIAGVPDYVKDASEAFVESLRKWARGGKDATEAELAQQGKAPEHLAAEAEAKSDVAGDEAVASTQPHEDDEEKEEVQAPEKKT